MTPEARVKTKVKRILSHINAYNFSPMTAGYGRSGVPDIIACYGGRFIAVECKANGNKPTALQLDNLQDIEACGGMAFVVDENNINEFERTMYEFAKKNTNSDTTG
jgi:hypothetical protein